MIVAEIICERIGTNEVYLGALQAIRHVLRNAGDIERYRVRVLGERMSEALTKIMREVWARSPWAGDPTWLDSYNTQPVTFVRIEYTKHLGAEAQRNVISITVPHKMVFDWDSGIKAKAADQIAEAFAHEVIHLRQFAKTPPYDYSKRGMYDPDYPTYMNKAHVHDPPQEKGWNGTSEAGYLGQKVEIQAYAQDVALALWRKSGKIREPADRRRQMLAWFADPAWMLKNVPIYKRYARVIRPRSAAAWRDFLRQSYQTIDRMGG